MSSTTLGERPELSDEVVALDGRAGHLAQLPDDHQHGRTGEIADEQRLGEQVGDHAEAGQSGRPDTTRPRSGSARRPTPPPGRGRPPASGAIAVPAIRAIVDSGPTDSTRDEPSAAYTISAASAVHSPATGGTPTSAV